jgi:hypothetical protein
MASMKGKAQCVFWFHETKSPLTVERNFRCEYGRPLSDVKSITGWYAKFKETGNVGNHKRTARPSVSEETVDAVRDAFQRSPWKSNCRASHELRIPQSTVVKILHKPWSQTIIPDVLLLLRRCCNELMKIMITLRVSIFLMRLPFTLRGR